MIESLLQAIRIKQPGIVFKYLCCATIIRSHAVSVTPELEQRFRVFHVGTACIKLKLRTKLFRSLWNVESGNWTFQDR